MSERDVSEIGEEPVYQTYFDNKTPFHYLAKPNQHKHGDDKTNTIKIIYIISVIIWVDFNIFLFQYYLNQNVPQR